MAEGHRAVSVLYQALLTGLVLTLVTRRSEDEAARFVFGLFRRQHLEKFRPGLAKLGLEGLPHAVACAQYHCLSNRLGDVKTEYAYESDRKAWVRYPPPRWIWSGATRVRQKGWRLDTPRLDAAAFEGWAELWHGALAAYDRRLRLIVTREAGAVEFAITSR